MPYIKTYIKADLNENVARGLAAAAVFLVTLIVVSLMTVKLSDAILNSKVGALDRSLGFLFGAVRGLLLCVIAFVFFNWLVPVQTQPEWVKTAHMRPLLQATGDQLMAVLPMPDDLEGFLNKLKKPKARRPQRGGGARHGSGAKEGRDRQGTVNRLGVSALGAACSRIGMRRRRSPPKNLGKTRPVRSRSGARGANKLTAGRVVRMLTSACKVELCRIVRQSRPGVEWLAVRDHIYR